MTANAERRRARLALAAAALAVLTTSCATARPKTGPVVVFPPPPQLPRIQYLTSFTGLKDIQKQSGFNRFVVGEEQDVKVDKPYGVAIHDGKIYVCDTNSTVLVFDLVKKTFAPLKGALAAGKLRQPINIFIEPDGTKYVTDPIRGQVVTYDRNDEYVRAYGTPGGWRPVDAVVFQDRLYVADAAGRTVRVLDKRSGEPVKTIGDRGEPTEVLDRPTNLAFDGAGFLYVTDVGRFQVVKYDRDGHFVTAFGKPGDNLGHFARPKGIALDREGHLYAVDASFNNVQMFNKEARLLMFFGEGGDAPGGLTLPAKVAIDYDNLRYFQQYLQPDFQAEYLLLVTSQFGPRRVNVLAYGKQKGARYPTDAELIKQLDERRQRELKRQPPPAEEPKPETKPQQP
jgi:DNA-binding beta-propeller fold protein YncE